MLLEPITAGLLSRPFENVVGADPPEQIKISLDLEGEAVVLCDSGFPNVREALHLFESQSFLIRRIFALAFLRVVCRGFFFFMESSLECLKTLGWRQS